MLARSDEGRGIVEGVAYSGGAGLALVVVRVVVSWRESGVVEGDVAVFEGGVELGDGVGRKYAELFELWKTLKSPLAFLFQ